MIYVDNFIPILNIFYIIVFLIISHKLRWIAAGKIAEGRNLTCGFKALQLYQQLLQEGNNLTYCCRWNNYWATHTHIYTHTQSQLQSSCDPEPQVHHCSDWLFPGLLLSLWQRVASTGSWPTLSAVSNTCRTQIHTDSTLNQRLPWGKGHKFHDKWEFPGKNGG